MHNAMLDSGAFSAWTQNEEVNIENYTDFVLKNLDYFSYIVNLDVIPGEWNRSPTKKEAEIACRKGWENYKYMLSKGIPADKLIHVFHQGDNFEWLEKFMKENLKYIGLSPANDKTVQEKIKWLDKCMEITTDKQGYPLNKWHGFAVTSLKMMLRYPWYSVDSSSWTTFARLGSILVPKYKKGRWVYDEQPWVLGMTSRSPFIDRKLKHFNNLSLNHKEVVKNYIAIQGYSIGSSHIENVRPDHKLKQGKELWYEKGKSVEVIDEVGLSNSNQQRNEINILYYQDLARSMPEWPWPFKHRRKRGSFL